MAEISGYTLEEQTAFLSFLDMVAEEDRPGHVPATPALSRAPTVNPAPTWCIIRRKDDVAVPVKVQGGPVQYGGRPAVAVIALDISAQIRLQNRLQQSQRLDNIGQLVKRRRAQLQQRD